jgi:hypothetical protein
LTTNKRQRICTKLDTQLKTILTAGEYETDLGNNIFEWRDSALQESELPGLIWRDQVQETDDTRVHNLDQHILPIEMEIITVGGTAITEIRRLIADVIRAIGAKRTWDGEAVDTKLKTSGPAIDQASRKVGAVMVTIEIIYRTDLFDAYN